MSAAPVHRNSAASPDARRSAANPWKVDLRELGRRPGSLHELQRTAPAPADWRVELIGVPEGAEIELALRLAEAQAEHEPLITETEVYRGAVSRADELGAQSHADAARMRAEVDEYVDTRLADFGTTLERMLRSVEKARTTLREP